MADKLVSAEVSDVTSTQYCQALLQLSKVSSSQLCVRLASGGDPVYAFNVKYTGEEVHGTSKLIRAVKLGQVTYVV